ncbi:MAG: hypothetical protein XD95_0611 [Microgenomates bacterium 39_7]|nr:MAG: hypothetical protein XD95_0611 [Microgenomates bacterium 39_7]
MSSKNNTARSKKKQTQFVFLSLVALAFLFWALYRFIFNFSVLFDETIGKAIFFGVPVIIYATVAKCDGIASALRPSKLFPGLLRGLAYGGIIGFLSLMIIYVVTGKSISSWPAFMADLFWMEFLLAVFTAFWESLFFFGFIQTTLGTFIKAKGRVILFTSLIFLLFHLPNLLLQFSGLDVTFLVALICLFGFGQALIFNQEENIYPLIITHTVWGMVLLIHF